MTRDLKTRKNRAIRGHFEISTVQRNASERCSHAPEVFLFGTCIRQRIPMNRSSGLHNRRSHTVPNEEV